MEAEDAVASETSSTERAQKATESCENLRAALEAEKKSNAALLLQVLELQKQMEALEGVALMTAETYKAVVEKYGGSTSALPSEATAFNLLSWLKPT